MRRRRPHTHVKNQTRPRGRAHLIQTGPADGHHSARRSSAAGKADRGDGPVQPPEQLKARWAGSVDGDRRNDAERKGTDGATVWPGLEVAGSDPEASSLTVMTSTAPEQPPADSVPPTPPTSSASVPTNGAPPDSVDPVPSEPFVEPPAMFASSPGSLKGDVLSGRAAPALVPPAPTVIDDNDNDNDNDNDDDPGDNEAVGVQVTEDELAWPAPDAKATPSSIGDAPPSERSRLESVPDDEPRDVGDELDEVANDLLEHHRRRAANGGPSGTGGLDASDPGEDRGIGPDTETLAVIPSKATGRPPEPEDEPERLTRRRLAAEARLEDLPPSSGDVDPSSIHFGTNQMPVVSRGRTQGEPTPAPADATTTGDLGRLGPDSESDDGLPSSLRPRRVVSSSTGQMPVVTSPEPAEPPAYRSDEGAAFPPESETGRDRTRSQPAMSHRLPDPDDIEAIWATGGEDDPSWGPYLAAGVAVLVAIAVVLYLFVL